MSLANKYRPRTFADVVEQRHIIDIIQAQVKHGHTSPDSRSVQNYLFYGPRGTGKTTTARLLAKAVNATDFGADWLPTFDSSKDENIALIETGKTLDIVEIDAASHTWVDNIREEILDKAIYPPTQLTKKVYVIDEVHMLSKGAFNALLKIMEEPGDHVLFILATTEFHKVPDTIVSRCQVFHFKKLPQPQIIERLQYIADQEKLDVDAAALWLIAQLSEGCLRDAIKYLDQVSILGTITQANVESLLWVAWLSAVEKMVEWLVAKEPLEQIVQRVTDIHVQWIDLHTFAKQVLQYCDDQFLRNPEGLSVISDLFKAIISDAKRYPHPLLLYKTKLYEFLNGLSAVEKKEVSSTNSPSILEGAGGSNLNPTPNPIPKPTPTNSNSTNHNLSELTTQFLAAIDKPSIGSILKDACSIKGIEDDVVSLICINPMAKMMLQKHENLWYLEEQISSLLWTPHTIKLVFMSKEDYMKEQIGLAL